MHDHDLDLIAEHASGLLTGAEAARAAAQIKSCEVCATEFADQRQIKALLGAAATPTLTEFERARLRRTVLDAAAPSGRADFDWRRRFLTAAGAVAAVAVFVVGIGVIGTFDSGGDDTVTLADGDTAATTSAQLRVPSAGEDGGGDDSAEEAFSAESLQADDPLADDAGAPAEERFSASLLLDAGTVSDTEQLDSILSEMTAVVAEHDQAVGLDEAVAFGATCAPLVEDQLLAAVLVTVDGTPTQVFLTGLRSEPVVVTLVSGDCTAPPS